MVQINQRQAAKPATGQGFRCPGTHAANTDHHSMRLAQLAQCRIAIKAVNAAKATLKINAFCHEIHDSGRSDLFLFLRFPVSQTLGVEIQIGLEDRLDLLIR